MRGSGRNTQAAVATPGPRPVGANLKRSSNVTPVQAGVERLSRTQAAQRLDPRLRGDDQTTGCLLDYLGANGIKSGVMLTKVRGAFSRRKGPTSVQGRPGDVSETHTSTGYRGEKTC